MLAEGKRRLIEEPLYKARRTLHTGVSLLTDRQKARIGAVFTIVQHVPVEATGAIYQCSNAAYRCPDKKAGKHFLQNVINDTSTSVPTGLTELRKHCRP